jgi:hypothetical protein
VCLLGLGQTEREREREREWRTLGVSMMSSGGGCSLLSSFEGGNLMHESLFQLSKIGTSSLVTARHVKRQVVTIRGGRAKTLEAGRY